MGGQGKVCMCSGGSGGRWGRGGGTEGALERITSPARGS